MNPAEGALMEFMERVNRAIEMSSAALMRQQSFTLYLMRELARARSEREGGRPQREEAAALLAELAELEQVVSGTAVNIEKFLSGFPVDACTVDINLEDLSHEEQAEVVQMIEEAKARGEPIETGHCHRDEGCHTPHLCTKNQRCSAAL